MDLSSRQGKSLAGTRPTNRIQKRGASKTGATAKRNPAINEGLAYAGPGSKVNKTGSIGGTTRMNTEAGVSMSVYKNVPISGRTSEVFNPAGKKDAPGFYVHKRGGVESRPKQRTRSNDQKDLVAGKGAKQQMTMEQLAREGAAQAMGQGTGVDSQGDNDPNDITAMSDLNSLQNFSYYGRRFQDGGNNRMQESPVASDAVSLSYGQGRNLQGPSSFGNQTAGAQFKIMRQGSSQQNQLLTDTNSENVSSIAGYYGRKSQAPPNQAGYTMEEKMNDNLMKQFQPMFSEDREIKNRHSNQDSALVNSVSDFSHLNESLGGITKSGTQSRAQLFAQAKEQLLAQRQGMAKTVSGFNQGAAGQTTAEKRRNTSGSVARAKPSFNSVNTSLNQMPKKNSTAAKVLPPKLPPRATMSPAMNSSFKANNLMASQSSVPTKQVIDTPLKDGMYFAHSGQPSQKTPQTEVVYKRGARSISRKRTDVNVGGGAGHLNLPAKLLNKQQVEESKAQHVSLLAAPRDTRNLQASESASSLHTAERAERYRGKCLPCVERKDCTEHSQNSSLDNRINKFNQNFLSTGHCRKHNRIGCERCSLGSSKGSRVSSLDSAHGALISRDVLRKHRVAPRSEIGLPQAKIAKSVTRQFKKPKQPMGVRNSVGGRSGLGAKEVMSSFDNRVRSLPRQQSSTLVPDTATTSAGVLDRAIDMRHSTKNADVGQLSSKLQGFRTKGNRPSVGHLPRPSTYTISGVVAPGGAGGREDNKSNDSRNLMSEYVQRREAGGKKNNVASISSIPNFSRILSAKTSIQRQDISRRMVQNQNDHGDLLQNDVKQLAEEWEGDPHDPEFWKRIEQGNDSLKEKKKNLVMGQDVRAKQQDLLERQSSVFKQLRETDEMTSERNSARGTAMNFNQARASLSRQLTRHMGSQRQSNTSLFTNTIQPGHEEPIQTEIDQHDMSMMQKDGMNFGASIVPHEKRMLQDPSQAVLTDYDIADEVGHQFGLSTKHQLEFRDRNIDDRIREDNNIEDLKRQLEKQINESKGPPRQVSDAGNFLYSGQTMKTGKGISRIEMGDIASMQQQSRFDSSQLTGTFPTSEKQEKPASAADEPEPQQPSCFEEQVKVENTQEEEPKVKKSKNDDGDKDSEDAESFDDEKQKSMVLDELGLEGFDENEEGQESDEDDKAEKNYKKSKSGRSRKSRKSRNDQPHIPGIRDDKVSEKSNEDEDEKAKKEIQEKTMANVIDYDDWLEKQTQKEIERLSQVEKQSRQGYFSPKSTLKIPEKGILKLKNAEPADESDRKRNTFTQFGHTEGVLGKKDLEELAPSAQDQQRSLAEAIQEQQSKRTRPKTRGDPITFGLDQGSTPKGELSSKHASGSGQAFSARRKTQEQSDSAKKSARAAPGSSNGNGAADQYLNSTQKMPTRINAGSEMRSPEKRFIGAAAVAPLDARSRGMVPSEKNIRSNAQMTVLASSLKDDDLMISNSQVDPLEGRSVRAKSRLDASDKLKGKLPQDDIGNLVIKEEENSSLKSVSPLTDASASKKSFKIGGSPAKPPPSQEPRPAQSQNNGGSQLPQLAKKGLPPKSPLLTNKLKQVLSPSRQQQEREPLPQLSDKKSSIQEQAETAKNVSFADYHVTPVPSDQQLLQQSDRKPQEPVSSTKPPISNRNQAVLDFLAYEDSDDDDFGMVIKNKVVPIPQTAPPQVVDRDDGEIIQLSPQKTANLAKTPSQQFVPNETFLHSNPTAMQALTKPLEELRAPAAKTPTTGLNNMKRKAIQLAMQGTQQSMPQRSASIEEPSVNEQINKIDYNQSNDGMSASFYRQHDQWLAMQNMQNMQNMPAGHQTLNSHRSSSRDAINKSPVPQIVNNRYHEPIDKSKIVDQAKEANKQVEELRKSAQSRTEEQQIGSRKSELRQSGSYQRPQGYVNKVLRQSSKSNLNSIDPNASLDRSINQKNPTQHTAEKFVSNRSSSRGRDTGGGASARAPLRQSSIASVDSRAGSSSKKQAFFSKHKDSIDASVTKSSKKRDTSNEGRSAAQNRLYGQETIASILKRNPELGYEGKMKKPPTLPPRRAPKKKVQKPPTPEPPKIDPPEEPLTYSPRSLQLPAESSVPDQENPPSEIPMKMRLPEEPPSEPSAYIMPNLYCPADPDTPYNFEIEPREEEYHYAPLEPRILHEPFEPEDPPYPERMIKMSTKEIMSERLDECETIAKVPEPDHDDEPVLAYPTQERPLILPPELPSKFEPPSAMLVDEPGLDLDVTEGVPTEADPKLHFLRPDQVERTHEMSIQCENVEEEYKYEESKQQSAALDGEPSDDDNFSVHPCDGVMNKVTVGIQTNDVHFRKIEGTAEFERKKQEKMESTDWALSPLFDDIHFAKEKRTVGGRKLMTPASTQTDKFENCGNQVEEGQIIQETAIQILSQIECEYNVDQLKRKIAGKDAIEDERMSELYQLGLNTLKALMLGLRLEKEWEMQTKLQYPLPSESEYFDVDETIKLLIRNKKMYEAKTQIQRLLKMIVERDSLVEQAQKIDAPEVRNGAIQGNIPLKKPQPLVSREIVAQIKRLSTRITSQINTLQEEHRIFRRPFILKGVEYLEQIQRESTLLEDLLQQKFFVDERGTAGSTTSQASR